MAQAHDRVTDRKDQILDTAEDLLRRYGIAKTTVSDVARALGLTHAAVYRHFESKAGLREAVAERWLKRVSTPLAAIAAECGDAEERLRRWLLTLMEMKRRKVRDDPEMFATYHALAEVADGAVSRHVSELERQVARILSDGMQQGSFRDVDPDAGARAILFATTRFHHPHFVAEAKGDAKEEEIRMLLDLVIAGIAADRG